MEDPKHQEYHSQLVFNPEDREALRMYLKSMLILENFIVYKYNFLSVVYDMMLFLEKYNIKYFFINSIQFIR